MIKSYAVCPTRECCVRLSSSRAKTGKMWTLGHKAGEGFTGTCQPRLENWWGEEGLGEQRVVRPLVSRVFRITSKSFARQADVHESSLV